MLKFEVSVEQDDTPVRGSLASGVPEYVALERADEDEILRRLDCGDVWAWALVTVKAILTTPEGERFEGKGQLGGCYYKDEDDFRADGYFDDMKNEALGDLRGALEYAVKRGDTATALLKTFDESTRES
jgi:hypothetical protein